VKGDKCQACGGPLGHKAIGTAALCERCVPSVKGE
jgi:hypothetical protein